MFKYLIERSIKEVDSYADVFHGRIVTAFAKLEDEAQAIQETAYEKAASIASPYTDPGDLAEDAYFEGVNFFLTTDAIRQGVVNLMIAGLYHLFEQHAAAILREFPAPQIKKPHLSEQLEQALLEHGISINSLNGWDLIEELRLVANTAKHGDGRSAEELKARNGELFEDNYKNIGIESRWKPPLRPLVGEGMRLNEEHFRAYAIALKSFWSNLLSVYS